MAQSALQKIESQIVADYSGRTPASAELFARACAVLPGGVSGNLRYFKPHPVYMRTGAGATCGSCLEMAADILQAAQPAPRESLLPILTLSNAA